MADLMPGEIRERQIRDLFTPGQQVEVRVDGVFQYVGTVVGYTRCASFRVREPGHGTVCDYHCTELTAA
jgi:hypothetical protein